MKKVTLNELMGKRGQSSESRKLTLDDLGDLLGERMPKLQFSPVGRLRLTSALRQRFGDNFKQLPGIEDILKAFDDEARFAVKLAEMKMIKPAKKVNNG